MIYMILGKVADPEPFGFKSVVCDRCRRPGIVEASFDHDAERILAVCDDCRYDLCMAFDKQSDVTN